MGLKRSPFVEIAHRALSDREKGFTEYLLQTVNLTLLEKEIIKKSELDKMDMETICNNLENWNKKSICSYANCARIKRVGMDKIGNYLNSLKVE